MDGRPTAKVGQGEVRLSVAAVGRPEKREKGLVLVDRQELPVTVCPPARWEVEPQRPGSKGRHLEPSPPQTPENTPLGGFLLEKYG